MKKEAAAQSLYNVSNADPTNSEAESILTVEEVQSNVIQQD